MSFEKNEINKDSITWAENAFKRVLLNRLHKEKIKCEVSHNQIIPISIKDLPKRSILGRRRAAYGYQIIRPDFIIPSFCLVIEIDGLIHDSSESKIAKDAKREEILNKMGFDVLRIPNRAIHSFINGRSEELERYLEIIIKISKTVDQKSFQPKRNKAKRKLTKARRRFRMYEKALENESKPHSYPNLKHIKSARKYGGYVYWVSMQV